MVYTGNRPPGGPTSNPPPDRWWLQDWTGGSGRDYQDQSFEEAYREFLRQQQQQQQPPPQQTNEGQTTETPGGTAPAGTPEDPVFKTEVIGNAPQVDPQVDPYLYEYLLSLPGGHSGWYPSGGGGPTFNVTGTDFMDPSYPFPGEYKVEDYDPNPPPGDYTFKTDVWDTTDPDDPLSPDKKKIKTYWDFPPELPDYKEKFQGWPEFKFEPAKPPRVIVPPKIIPKLDDIKTQLPPIPNPKQQQQQQKQQPGVGKLLAALPMLAAFQGGTTTTPAPYAHLGPHTPVAPVFKPQGRGNPVPSIGQLLAGVR